jgi:hypothetical protein
MQQMIRCPNCGSPNSYGVPYCAACGSPLPSPCPNCGAGLEAGARFCGNCGAQLGGAPMGGQQGGWGQTNFPQQGNYNPQPGWGQQPPPQQQWGQQPPPQQQWGQQPQQQQWGQQQGGWDQPQEGGWGVRSQAAPQQGSWGAQQPPRDMGYSSPWGAAPRQKSSTGLVILLVVLLIALVGFGYWAFFASPWQGSGTTAGGTAKVSEGPFFSSVSDNASTTRTMTITFKSNEASKARVAYGPDTKYGSYSNWEGSSSTDHSVTIKDLTPETSYHIQIYLRDKNNKDSYSIDYPFKTPK